MSRTLIAALVLGAHALAQPAAYLPFARECPSIEPLCSAARIGELPTSDEVASATPTLALLSSLVDTSTRGDDAVSVFERLVAGDVATAAGALELMADRGSFVRTDGTRDYRPRILAAVAPLSKRIDALPREDAARLAWAIKQIELAFGDPRANDWEPAQREFVAAYPDTEAARLVQVELLGSLRRAPILQVIDDLERYGREHAASVDGAKAMWSAAFQLGSNLQIGNHIPRDADPTDYVLRTMKIVNDLEHGRYPKCHWIDDAPSLVSGFFINPTGPPPNFAPGNLERLIAAYQHFVNTHFDAKAAEDPYNSPIGYVMTGRLPQLYKWMNVTDGLERVIRGLEDSGADRAAVALFRADNAVRQAMAVPAKVADARAALDALSASREGYPARKALAESVSFAMAQGDDDGVVSYAERYLSSYPSSPWAWVAALRLGQAHEHKGNTANALVEYQHAESLSALPVARIVAAVYEGRAHEQRNEFDQALDAYRRAIDTWGTDALSRIDSETRQRPGTLAPGAAAPPTGFTRQQVLSRAESLERYGSVAGGELLLKAEHLIEQRDFSGAEASAREFLRARGNSAAAPAARALMHDAQLEAALLVGGKDSNDPAFLAALTSLASEPFDGPVAVSRIARAMLLERQGDHEAASLLVTSTLDAWRKASVLPQSRDAGLDRDVAAVLEASTDYVTAHGVHDSYGKPPLEAAPGSRRVIFSDIQLRVAGAAADATLPLALLPQSWTNVIVASRQDADGLSRIANAIAGRKPASEQPLIAFWLRFFPAPSNSWRGYTIETYPSVREVEFLDPGRTTAAARVSVDAGSGFTAILERQGPNWVVVRITNQWIS